MILYDAQNRTYTIHTQNTTYQMKVWDYQVLLHAYYGPRVEGADLSYLLRCRDRGFSPNPNEAGGDRTFSLDTFPQEYSTFGVGDYRLPSIELESSNGSHTVDLRYVSGEVRKGKYGLEGLPAFYGGGDAWETLSVILRDAAAQIEVELLYGVLEKYDLITRAVRVKNVGRERVRVLRCASLCLDFIHSGLDMITFNGAHVLERSPCRVPLHPGIQGVDSTRGASSHQHNPFVILCGQNAEEDHGLCYGVMLLYSGNFQALAEVDQFQNSRLVMGLNPYQFSWTLEPGMSFTSPEAALVCSPSGFGQMSRQFHKAIRKNLIRDPYAGRRKPVLINNWEATEMNFTADKLVEFAREASGLGLELFVMDDGWFGARNDDNAGLGDWTVNEKKLPGGLKALVERIKALGMAFGLWIEPEMVNEDSDLYRAHPDWILNVPGRGPSRSRNQLVLDFSRQDVRDNIYEQIKKVLASADISYVKWDMNRSLTEVWSAALPAGRQGEVYHRYVLGVYEFAERLRQDFPGILLEGCCGGGGRFDGGMLYYTPQIWCSDNTDAADRLRIQYGTSFCYPVSTMGAHVSAVPNGTTKRIIPIETRDVVAMHGTFGYEMDLRACTPEEKETVRRQTAQFKEHRALIQEGDYYRLSDPFQNGPYTAWEHVSANRREALVSVVTGTFRGAPPFLALPLKGLDPALRYRVNGEGGWPGAALMQAGWPLPIPDGDYQSFQLYLEAE